MYSKVFAGAALLGAASALPQGSRPSGPPSMGSESAPSGPPSKGPEGAPSGPPPWAFGEERLADFDNLQPAPLVALTPTGEYKDLYYQGFATIEAGLGSSQSGGLGAGLSPQSESNYIVSGFAEELLDGPPTFYAEYADSEVKDFDLKSLYFGCTLATLETVASVPVACTIKATAYGEEDGVPVASQEFEFNPDALLARMDKVEFGKGFEHVKKVQFDTTATADEVVATIFDDVSYEIYKKNPFEEKFGGKKPE